MASARAREQVAGGFRFQFAPRPDLLKDAAAVIDAEHRCCRFLRFLLLVEPGEGPVWLEVTGPEGTREFLAEFLDTAVRNRPSRVRMFVPDQRHKGESKTSSGLIQPPHSYHNARSGCFRAAKGGIRCVADCLRFLVLLAAAFTVVGMKFSRPVAAASPSRKMNVLFIVGTIWNNQMSCPTPVIRW